MIPFLWSLQHLHSITHHVENVVVRAIFVAIHHHSDVHIVIILLSAFEFDCVLNKLDMDVLMQLYGTLLPESQTRELTQI